MKSEPYRLVHASAGYRGAGWSVGVWGKNLADEDYAVRGFHFGNDPVRWLHRAQLHPTRHAAPLRHLGLEGLVDRTSGQLARAMRRASCPRSDPQRRACVCRQHLGPRCPTAPSRRFRRESQPRQFAGSRRAAPAASSSTREIARPRGRWDRAKVDASNRRRTRSCGEVWRFVVQSVAGFAVRRIACHHQVVGWGESGVRVEFGIFCEHQRPRGWRPCGELNSHQRFLPAHPRSPHSSGT